MILADYYRDREAALSPIFQFFMPAIKSRFQLQQVGEVGHKI